MGDARGDAPGILLLGATGRVGGATLRHLLSAAPDRPIRILTRRPETVDSRIRDRVKVIGGQLDDTEHLGKLLRGIDTLLLVLGDHPGMARQEMAVIDAARRSGAVRIVKISAITAGLDPRRSFGIQHGAVEDHLRDSGLPFVILRPTFFFQSLELFAAPIRHGFLPAATGQGAMGFVDLEDVARVACQVLLDSQADGSTRVLTGPASLTMSAVADELSRHLGHRIRHVRPPAFLMKLLLRRGAGLNPWLAQQVVDLMRCCAEGGEDQVTDTVSRLTGTAPGSLRDYLEKNAKNYQV